MQLKWTTNLNFPLAKRTKQNEKKHLRLGYMQKTTYFCRTIISFYPISVALAVEIIDADVETIHGATDFPLK